MSSMAGIGGGPMYTPLEIRVMRMPVALAVPTAHVVFTALAVSGLALHLATGDVGPPLRDAPWLAAGMLPATLWDVASTAGSTTSSQVRLLAAGMVLVAARTGLSAL